MSAVKRSSTATTRDDIEIPSPALTAAMALSDGWRFPVSRNEMNLTETSARSAKSSWVMPAAWRASRRASAKAVTRCSLLRFMAGGIPHGLTPHHEQLF